MSCLYFKSNSLTIDLMSFVFKHPSKYKKFKITNVNTVATNSTKVQPVNTTTKNKIKSLKQNKKIKTI